MTDSAQPTSTRPYLVRAIHEWCLDNGLTPYLAVSVTDEVRVPREHVRNGEIVLNISTLATDKLVISNDDVCFQARFSGRVQEVYVPMANVVAIYAKETGNGMAFEVPKPLAEAEQDAPAPASPGPSAIAVVPTEPPPRTPGGKPKLTRVK